VSTVQRVGPVIHRVRSAVAAARRRRQAPLDKRYAEGRVPTPLIEALSDEDLQTLNGLLPWQCFTVDAKGRPFGRPAWQGKRVDPQLIPDPRIEQLDARFSLAGKHVLEIGCFEGVHTIALAQRAGAVSAIDSRVENVAKTIVRSAFFGLHPDVFVFDVDTPDAPPLPGHDVCHHVGVLYHLIDPVAHLERLLPHVRQGIMLDTHIAQPGDTNAEYAVGGTTYRYRHYDEGGRADVFSGMHNHAKWLLLSDLEKILRAAGLTRIDVAEQRDERNGPRILLYAERES
jgi:tRNA (mo5U34)-methyltransferase